MEQELTIDEAIAICDRYGVTTNTIPNIAAALRKLEQERQALEHTSSKRVLLAMSGLVPTPVEGYQNLDDALYHLRAELNRLLDVLHQVDNTTRNNCPLCGSGVNKFGHLSSCRLYQALPMRAQAGAAGGE